MTISFTSPILRFAPSPTGRLHIGNLRVAILNHLIAKRHNGSFHLRIEDTDIERSEQRFVEKIYNDLNWLGINYEKNVIHQSENRSLYDSSLEKLKEENLAYPCFCSKEKIEKEKIAAKLRKEPYRYSRTCRSFSQEEAAERMKTESHVFRFDSQKGAQGKTDVKFLDKARGEQKKKTELIEDFILLRSDGNYSFAFTSTVDDIHLGTTDIIRGEDHLSNSFKQRLLFENLAPTGSYPAYIHLSLLLKEDRTPLSKRHGSLTVDDFIHKNILPEVVYYFSLFPGWSPKGSNFDDSRDVYTDELKEHLSNNLNLYRLSKSAAVFDMQRLLWFNGYYIKGLDTKRFIKTLESLNELDLNRLIIEKETAQAETLFIALKNNFSSFEEFQLLLSPFLTSFSCGDLKLNDAEKDVLQATLKALPVPQEGKHLAAEEIKALFKTIKQEVGVKGKGLYHPIRLALTGADRGVELHTIMEVLPLVVIHARILSHLS